VDSIAARAVEDEAVAAVHLFVEGEEFVFGDGTVECGDVEVEADHAEFVECSFEFAE
jgi:hypothetical protein